MSVARTLWHPAGLVLSLALGGCAWLTPPAPAPLSQTQALPSRWDVAGRLSVKVSGKGSYGNFDWRRQSGVDTFDITTPLGQTLARLVRHAEGVTLTARGETHQAQDAEQLSQSLLGWSLPANVRAPVLQHLGWPLDEGPHAAFAAHPDWARQALQAALDDAAPMPTEALQAPAEELLDDYAIDS